jgi:endoglucanase
MTILRIPLSPRSRPFLWVLAFALTPSMARAEDAALRHNDRGYFSMPGLDVMAFQDVYPEGHQGGVGIIQNGVRVATNGDVRLEPTPGQWAPVPNQVERTADPARGEITVRLAYPDPAKDRKGFNPIEYPDLRLPYAVRVSASGTGVRVVVDLDEPLPREWIGKVGFNLELYPAALFGRSWALGGRTGIFPRQPDGPVTLGPDGEVQATPFASGPVLSVAPESPAQLMTIESRGAPLELLDGRVNHQNGWFVVRSLAREGATKSAVEWIVTPHALPGWTSPPVVHVSQVGYHPDQPKVAVIELDAAEEGVAPARVVRIGVDGSRETALTGAPRVFGPFLRYRYLQLDFSGVKEEGTYVVEYAETSTGPFRIARDVYARDVWQPTLDSFLPVQMCHMRVVEKYKVWHGLCHMDDARMAPPGHLHFDGYAQGDSTLTRFEGGEPVPGLNVGGWHDAGDDDLRIESQAGEVYVLSLIQEAFGPRLDDTTVDEERRSVEMRQPDGKPDLLQQIAHGALHVVGVYDTLGRLDRGVISPTLKQYVMVGDVSNQTDGLVFDPSLREGQRTATRSAAADDRWVFTEKNVPRALGVAADMAAAARTLRGYDDALAADCLRVAEAVWSSEGGAAAPPSPSGIRAAVELFLTTRKDEYRRAVLSNQPWIVSHVAQVGWIVARALAALDDTSLTSALREAVAAYAAKLDAEQRRNPFGVPYKPVIWGAGWNIERFGVEQYFLHRALPDLVGRDAWLSALDFVLGCHPGSNTASFASGVGSRSMTVAYGYNRADWGYIPGGVVSGTNLVRPDFPEMKDFPYLWQQAEYVMGGGATNFMFLALAAEQEFRR